MTEPGVKITLETNLGLEILDHVTRIESKLDETLGGVYLIFHFWHRHYPDCSREYLLASIKRIDFNNG